MSVNVLRAPVGFQISDTTVSAEIVNTGDGKATIAKVGHGLTNGTIVYIVSKFETYCGFFRVTNATTNNFKINDLDALNVFYIQADESITYQVGTGQHNWNAVHLPIQYVLSNDLFPTNSVDSIRTISNVTNSNGQCLITASGDIKASGSANKLNYVRVTGTDNLDGVYQITSYSSDTSFVISLAYDSTNDADLTGASVQYYYNNYNIKIKVLAGIPAADTWASMRPVQEIAILDFIPDSDNKVIFSAHEILKSQLKTKNNTLLDTLPNNIDFWTSFFIDYAEVYDQSDGTNISQIPPFYTRDESNYTGYAANSMLPFKNIHGGHLSEYLMNNSAGKFLTLFPTLKYFDGGYQDISFIRPNNTGTLRLKKEYIDIPNPSVVNYEVPAIDLWTNASTGQNWNYSDYFGDGSLYVWSTGPVNTSKILDTGLTIPSIPTLQTLEGTLQVIFDNEVAPFVWDLEIYLFNSGSSTWVLLDTVQINEDISVVQNIPFSGTASANSTKIGIKSIENFGVPTLASISIAGITMSNGSSEPFLTEYDTIPNLGLGVYRFPLSLDCQYENARISLDLNGSQVSEYIPTVIDCNCTTQELRLTWLNYLGGFDYWVFKAKNREDIDIEETGTTDTNIFPNWNKSYSAFADTIQKQTFRRSRNKVLVRSQPLSLEELQALKYIRTSPLVQIINSRQDRKTVIVDQDSFTVYDAQEGNKNYTISFSISYTDEIPSQRV